MKNLITLLLASALSAQTVHIANDSPVPFEGWVRCTVDVMPPHRSGLVTHPDGATYRYVLGRETGLDTRALDVQVQLEPGQHLTLELGKANAFDATRPPLSDLQAFCGGVCSIAGTRFKRVDYAADGAGYLVHYRARTGRMLCTDLWLHWIPEQAWIRGEVLVTCSNPAVEDIGENIPEGFMLRVGDGVLLVPGRRAGDPLVDAGTHLGDGQARGLPLVAFFPRHANAPRDWSSIGALERVHAVGISRLWPQGNPRVPAGLDVQRWTEERVPESVRRLHTFERALLGPNPRSGDTGAQSDQVFVAGEPLLPGGCGAVWPVYLAALKMAARPCHHLEADGSQLSMTTHPQLVMWDSRPHWHTGVSPDRLGKGSDPLESSSWYGADVEHWFHNNTVAAARYTGSPLLQHLLGMQARIYPYQHTTDPRLIYQSVPHASRAVGWEAIMAVHLWQNLQDRELAARVRAHWRDRADRVLIPQLSPDPRDWRRDDRLGPGLRWMPWQHGVQAYGLDLAGELLEHNGARKLALQTAEIVMREAYWHDGTRWTSRDVVAQDAAAVTSGHYDLFGSPLAPAVILRHEADVETQLHQQAKDIWQQLLREASEAHHWAWLAP